MSNIKDLLTVSRFKLRPDWTIGKLLLDNNFDGYTVEDEIRAVKVHGETAIPYGRYKLGVRQSPHFSKIFLYSDAHNILIEPEHKNLYPEVKDWRDHDLCWVMNVPGFEYVLIHWGNTDLDTEGCLIVGSSMGPVLKNGVTREGVLSSRDYYKKLYCKIYPLIKKGNQTINYIKAEV